VLAAPTISAGATTAVATLASVGAAPRLPGGAVRVGPLTPSKTITIGVALAVRAPAQLAAAAAAAAADRGPGARMTPAQFAATYGPSPAAVRRVNAALRALGLTPGAPSANGLVIPVTATAGRLAHAFGARLDAVRLPDGMDGWAPEAAPVVPAAVAYDVAAILGLSNVVVPHDQLARPRLAAAATPSGAQAASTGSRLAPSACPAAKDAAVAAGGWTDDQVAKAYGLNHLYARHDFAAGQTIAVYELEPFEISDVASFDRCFFGRSHADQIGVEKVDGFSLTGQGAGEAVLDVENVSALAPAAHILVYEAPNTSFGAIDEYNAIVSEDRANIVTTSWGECEQALDAGSPGARALENVLFEEAALQGQTVVAASGDAGSDDCANTPFGSSAAVKPYLSVDDPASQPYVLAVGGTSLNSVRPPLSATDETVWNDGSTDGAAGGGSSSSWPSPAWQSSSGVLGLSVGGPRQLPDVSASADQSRGVTIFAASRPPTFPTTAENAPSGGFGWSTIGGTSSAAPIWAAVLAEIAASGVAGTSCSSAPVTVGGADLGFVPPDLYSVARFDYGGAFHDIIRGNNDAFGIGSGYTASAAYDTASGLGTPVVVGRRGMSGLASDLCSVATGTAPVLPLRPTVLGITPAEGSIAGGNAVTIALAAPVPSGTAVSVQFGATTAAATVRGSALSVVAPAAVSTPGAASFSGAGPVTVTVAYASATGLATSFPTAAARYEYVSTISGAVGPTVTGIGPSGGPPSGGGTLTIYGSGFAASTDVVTVGGVSASGVVVVSDHEITALAPPRSASTACATGPGFDPANNCATEVVVTNATAASPISQILPSFSGPVVFTPQGIVSQGLGTEIAPAATEYDYSPVPVITSVTPNPAASQGTSPIIITGSGLSLNSFEWVNFGPASSPASQQLKILGISPTSITIDPPAAPSPGGGALGGGLSVATVAGVSNVVPFGYAGVPIVRSLSSHDGRTLGGTRITIMGARLLGVTSVQFVSQISVARFGESTTTNFQVIDRTHLRVVVPAGRVGPVDVEPCTPTGCAAPDPRADSFDYYTLAKPQVTSATPSSGSASGGDLVVIRGNNLAGAVAVYFGSNSSSSFTNANGFAPGSPDAIAVYAAPGTAGSTVPITVVTRAGRTLPVPGVTYTYRSSGPSAPRRAKTTAVPAGLLIRWTEPISNGGASIIGFAVEAADLGGTPVRTRVAASERSVVLTGMTPGRTYVVTVTAVSASGQPGRRDVAGGRTG
jgi:hypothetical protein